MRSSERSIRPDGRQKDKRKIPRPPERCLYVRVFSPEEQAVSDERFDRVQRILASIRESHEVFVHERHHGSMLAGVGFCGLCSLRLGAKTRSRRLADGSKSSGHYVCSSQLGVLKNPVPRCSNSWVPKERLDALASKFVEKCLDDPEFTSAILNFAREKQSNIVGFSVEEATKARLDDLSRRDARIMAAIESGAMDVHEAKQARLRLQTQRQALLSSMERTIITDPGQVELQGIAGKIANGNDEWLKLVTPREKKDFIAKLFTEIYFRHQEITGFRLAPGLVGGGVWKFASEMPVILETPFRITDPDPEVPEGMRRCPACKEIKEFPSQFYGDRPRCRKCARAACKSRYEAKRRENGK
jgi:hypothetical protein